MSTGSVNPGVPLLIGCTCPHSSDSEDNDHDPHPNRAKPVDRADYTGDSSEDDILPSKSYKCSRPGSNIQCNDRCCSQFRICVKGIQHNTKTQSVFLVDNP